MTAPTLSVLDDFQESIKNVHIHKVAVPPIRSEWRVFTANGISTTNDVGNQVSFSILPPSNTTIVDRRMYLRLTIRVTPSSLLQGGVICDTVPIGALRAFPVNSLIQQSNININGGGGFITNNSEVLYPLKRYLNFVEEEGYFNSPTMPDPTFDLKDSPPFQNFAAAAAATRKIFGNVAAISYPAPSSVFSGCTDNVVGSSTNIASGNVLNGRNFSSNCRHEPRGYFPYTVTPFNANNQKIHTYTVTENILNGFLEDAEVKSGIVNVSKLDIQLNLEPKLRAWSTWAIPVAAGVGPGDRLNESVEPTVEVINAELIVHFITPSIPTIPGNMVTGFTQYLLHKTNAGTVAAHTTGTFNFTNITMNTVPQWLYIFVRPSITSQTYSMARGEFCAKISKLSINLGTSFGHLSQMDEHSLYLLCRDNGLKQDTFVDFVKFTGSVICIDAAKDLGLVPGQVRYFPIDFKVDFENISTEALSFDVNLLSIIPGTASISPDLCTSFLGFSAQDEGNATRDSTISETKLVPDMPSGSGFH